MGIIIPVFWAAIATFPIASLWLLVKWVKKSRAKKRGENPQDRLWPWGVAVLLLGALALLLIFFFAGFSNGL